MNQIEPLVSIILPVCNAAKYLPDCLESLLKQKHAKIEVIAIDDFSKDDSVAILKAYQKTDRRIKVFTNVKRYGIAVSLNRAIKNAKGDFITFTNPNDVNSVWRIKKQLDFLSKNPKVVAVGTQAVSIDDAGKHVERTNLPVEHEHIYQSFLKGLAVQFETIMINRTRIPKDLLHFTHNKYPFVYVETFMKLFQYGKFANLLQHLYYHRGYQVGSGRITRKERMSKFVQIAIKSVAIYDYRPSIRSFLSPTARA
jgi:glycosyltransferase involved in cell wall biosynthesis